MEVEGTAMNNYARTMSGHTGTIPGTPGEVVAFVLIQCLLAGLQFSLVTYSCREGYLEFVIRALLWDFKALRMDDQSS